MDHVGESDSLWLTREPEYEEIIEYLRKLEEEVHGLE